MIYYKYRVKKNEGAAQGSRLLCFREQCNAKQAKIRREGQRPTLLYKDHKQRGQWVELLFMARAAQYGLGVAKPLGDWEYYDAAVQHKGRFLSVQVKSVMHREYRSYRVSVIAGSNRLLYPTSRLDFFAIYIVPRDLWYIIPCSIIPRKQTSVTLAPEMKGHKYERYKEAWHLLFRTRTRKRRLIINASRAPHQ